MKVLLAADFSGYPLKEGVKAYLLEHGHEVIDLGQSDTTEKVLYPDAASRIAKSIQQGEAEKGFLFCGTGAGVSIAANKFKGVYCVACESIFTAENLAVINGANLLAMGNHVVGLNHACRIADVFLEGSFCKGFTPERKEFVSGLRQALRNLEDENMK